MRDPVKSILVFGIYMIAFGMILLIIPNFYLALGGIPPTNEVWIRVVGMLLFLIGCYYVQAARAKLYLFFYWTVYARASVIVFLTYFVLAGLSSPVLLLIGIIDLLGAIWTALALRSAKLP